MSYFKGEKEFFPGIGQIQLRDVSQKIRWHFIIMTRIR